MKIFFLLSLLFGLSPLIAQHPYYASPDQQLLMLNPAFAGTDKQLRIQTIANITDANTNFSASSWYTGIDMLLGKRHGLGLTFHNQQFGQIFSKNQFDINYAFHFGNKNFKIIPAVKLSYYDVRIKTDDLLFGDMISAQSGFVWNTNEHRPDIDTIKNWSISNGLLVYAKNFYFGASWLDYARVFGKPRVSDGAVPGVVVAQTSYKFSVKSVLKFNIYAFGKIELPQNSIYQYGTYIGFRFFNVHIAHRFNNALVTGFNLNKFGVKIGYNNQYHYKPDYPSKFSHEIYLSVNFSKIRRSDN